MRGGGAHLHEIESFPMARGDRLRVADALPVRILEGEVPYSDGSEGRILEILAGAERLRAWLVTGRRVRAWARERGHDEAVWMVPDPYPPAPLDLDDQL